MMTRDRYRWLALGWTILIVVLCLTPKAAVPEGTGTRVIPHLDKIIHFALFAGFGFLWTASVRSKGAAIKVLVAGFALAAGTELLQGLPGVNRDPDTIDVMADSLGAVAGVVVGLAAHRGTPREG